MKRLKKNREKGVSKIEVIRESLDNFLREIPLGEGPEMSLIGLGNSGKRNLSDHHDKYLIRYVRRKKVTMLDYNHKAVKNKKGFLLR